MAGDAFAQAVERHGAHAGSRRGFLDLPDNLMIYSGMALGQADEHAPINRWRSPREPLDSFATFSGFTS